MQTELKEALEDHIHHLRGIRSAEPEMYGRVYKTLGDLLHSVRCQMDETREELGRPSLAEREAAAAADLGRAAGYAELLDTLRNRARSAQFTAPEDSELRRIAKLAAEKGWSLYDVVGGKMTFDRSDARAIMYALLS